MSEGPEPTPIDVPEHAIPATYRRAPRTERFIITGIGIGALAGLLVGVLLPAGSGVGRATAGLLVALAGALAGGLVSGSQAAIMEYTSGRSADRQRHDIEADWEPIVGMVPESRQVDGSAASHDGASSHDSAAPHDSASSHDSAASHDSADPATDDDEGAGNGSR